MSEQAKCEHGAELNRHLKYPEGIAFACPLETCSCCGTIFPYIDSELWSVEKDGKEKTEINRWEPADCCELCGGRYVHEVRIDEPEIPSDGRSSDS